MGFSGHIPNQFRSSASGTHGWAMLQFREIVGATPSDSPPTIIERLATLGSSDTGMSFTLGVASISNVVANRREYAFISQRLYQEDEQMGICIYNTCAEIEAMCDTIYQLPETVPHCKQVIALVLESLAEYRELSDRIVAIMRNYSRDISE